MHRCMFIGVLATCGDVDINQDCMYLFHHFHYPNTCTHMQEGYKCMSEAHI